MSTPSLGSEPIAFERGGETYTLHARVCTDPACDADDASFEIRRGEQVVGRFDVDLGTGAVLGEPSGPDWVGTMASVVPEEARARWADIQRKQRYLRTVRIPRSRLAKNRHVMYSSLLSPEPSIYDGGHSALTVFEHGGTAWAVDEGYCPKPDCHCEEGSMHASRVNGGADVGFTAVFRLGSLPALEDVHGGMKRADAEALLAAYVAEHPDLVEAQAERYRVVKEVGRRSAAGKVLEFGKKPSRNAPCPCGSGKRYKACCGR